MRKKVDIVTIKGLSCGTIDLPIEEADCLNEALCGLHDEAVNFGRDGQFAWVLKRNTFAQETETSGVPKREYKSLANFKDKAARIELEIQK